MRAYMDACSFFLALRLRITTTVTMIATMTMARITRISTSVVVGTAAVIPLALEEEGHFMDWVPARGRDGQVVEGLQTRSAERWCGSGVYRVRYRVERGGRVGLVVGLASATTAARRGRGARSRRGRARGRRLPRRSGHRVAVHATPCRVHAPIAGGVTVAVHLVAISSTSAGREAHPEEAGPEAPSTASSVALAPVVGTAERVDDPDDDPDDDDHDDDPDDGGDDGTGRAAHPAWSWGG
jgi:hypothetical protein